MPIKSFWSCWDNVDNIFKRTKFQQGDNIFIIISAMFLVLVFGLLFYVKNDWCDLLFKNFTVGVRKKQFNLIFDFSLMLIIIISQWVLPRNNLASYSTFPSFQEFHSGCLQENNSTSYSTFPSSLFKNFTVGAIN